MPIGSRSGLARTYRCGPMRRLWCAWHVPGEQPGDQRPPVSPVMLTANAVPRRPNGRLERSSSAGAAEPVPVTEPANAPVRCPLTSFDSPQGPLAPPET